MTGPRWRPTSPTTAATDDTTDPTPPDTAGEVDTTVAENTDAPVMGGSLIMGLEAEAPGLRPWEDACSESCANVARTVFDVLVQQNADGVYEGILAESIEPNDDFTEWTMTLRPDVTFHNEVPLTAQTIVDMFAIQQTGTQSSGQIATYGITGVSAVDDLTVLYTLGAPNSAFPAAINSVPLGYVFEPGAAVADPVGFSTNPVGAGPFVMQSRDIDNETVVVRNPNYWRTDAEGNQLPYLDQVAFRAIPDEGTRLDALISGTVNMMETRRQGTIRDARAESGISLNEFQGNNTGGGMVNTAVPPFDDVRVRLGLNKLNDPERSDGKSTGEPIDVELSCPPDPSLIAAMQVIEPGVVRLRVGERQSHPVRSGDPHQQRRRR